MVMFLFRSVPCKRNASSAVCRSITRSPPLYFRSVRPWLLVLAHECVNEVPRPCLFIRSISKCKKIKLEESRTNFAIELYLVRSCTHAPNGTVCRPGPFHFHSIPVSLNAIRHFQLHGNGICFHLHGTERKCHRFYGAYCMYVV